MVGFNLGSTQGIAIITILPGNNSLALINKNEIECESIEIFPAVISLKSFGK